VQIRYLVEVLAYSGSWPRPRLVGMFFCLSLMGTSWLAFVEQACAFCEATKKVRPEWLRGLWIMMWVRGGSREPARRELVSGSLLDRSLSQNARIGLEFHVKLSPSWSPNRGCIFAYLYTNLFLFVSLTVQNDSLCCRRQRRRPHMHGTDT